MADMTSADDIAEAGRMLRAFAKMPAESHQERATARRIEGAAATLEALADLSPQTNESEAADPPK